MKCQPKVNNNREAVVVSPTYVVKQSSKRLRASIYIFSDNNGRNYVKIEKQTQVFR